MTAQTVQRQIRGGLTHQFFGAFRLDGLEHDERVVRADEQFEIGECVGGGHDTLWRQEGSDELRRYMRALLAGVSPVSAIGLSGSTSPRGSVRTKRAPLPS